MKTSTFLPLSTEEPVVDVNVVNVDGVVEGEDDHLRRLLREEPSGDLSAARGTETVGQLAKQSVDTYNQYQIFLKSTV